MLKKLIILCSGNGSNLQAIIDAIKAKKVNGKIEAVITNKDCFAQKRAKAHKIPYHTLYSKNYKERKDFDIRLQNTIDQYQPDLVILAGFMRILTANFVNHYQDKLINIHPALLPKYKGLHTHQRALAAKDNWHGSSVHNVTEDVDDGAVIAQSHIKILEKDTAELLDKKVKKIEHRLYPKVIALICSEKITISNNIVYYNRVKLTEPLLI